MNAESKKIETVRRGSNKLSLWLFVYALCYAVFHITPPYLMWEVKNLLMVGDLFDILTPFVMAFLIFKIYRILRRHTENLSPSTRSIVIIILIFGGIAFVEGHGMHLSANAIARHLTEMKDTPAFALTYLFDETLGHILWDSGIVILSVGLIIIGFHVVPNKASRPKILRIAVASLFYGFTYFVNAVEGQTVIFMFPLAIVVPVGICWLARRRHIGLLRNPVLSFFLFNHLLASCLFLLWGIWHGGFPEFSKLGWV